MNSAWVHLTFENLIDLRDLMAEQRLYSRSSWIQLDIAELVVGESIMALLNARRRWLSIFCTRIVYHAAFCHQLRKSVSGNLCY